MMTAYFFSPLEANGRTSFKYLGISFIYSHVVRGNKELQGAVRHAVLIKYLVIAVVHNIQG